MGIDAELYIIGPHVPDAQLALLNIKMRRDLGPTWRDNREGLTRYKYFDSEVVHVLEMDLDGARYFWGDAHFSGWPTIISRIRYAQRMFPHHELIYWNDASFLEEHTFFEVVSEHMLENLQAQWDAGAPELFKQQERSNAQ